jgi:hypothetical protein
MVKRTKVEDIAGVLEFAGLTKDDPEFTGWLDDHKAHNGGKLRISRGATGVRVAFSNAGDMARWRAKQTGRR